MGTIKWYKRDPRAAIAGMAGLSLVERGAYNTILDLIYTMDGKLPDNGKLLAYWLHVEVRQWKRIRKRLLEKGKIYIYAGEIHNERADIEVRETLEKIRKATEAINKRWATYNEIKRMHDTNVLLPTTRKKDNLSANIVPLSGNRERK